MENLWDSETIAYYNLCDRDWSELRKRGFHSAGDGITVHGLADYLLTGAEAKRERVHQNADNLTYNIVAHTEDEDVIFEFP